MLLVIAGFVLAAGTMGLLFLWEGMRVWRLDAASQRWPSVEGRVTASTPKSDVGAAGIRYTKLTVDYEYTVSERDYHNSTHDGIDAPAFEAGSQTTATAYEPGRMVTVRYDPADPRRALLEHAPVPLADTVLALAFGTAILAASLMLAITAFALVR